MMTLGIIGPPNEESFKMAKSKGLDMTDWGAFMAILYGKQYEGGLSIEPHSKVWSGELGEKGIDFTVAYMKKLLFR